MKIKIYHNSRCSKSREGLAILEKNGRPFEVIDYLKNGFASGELEDLFKIIQNSPSEIIRQKEAEFDKKIDLTNASKIIAAIYKNPKLLERPIVVVGKKAIIGRPPELIKKIL